LSESVVDQDLSICKHKKKVWKSKLSDSITACLDTKRCNVIVKFSQHLKPQVSTIA